MAKWLPPVLLAGLAAVLAWLLLRRSSSSAPAGVPRRGADPNAALGAAVCTAGTAYYGGATAGLGALPLCTAAGEALAPVVGKAVGTTVELLDDAGGIVGTVSTTASGAIEAVGGLTGKVFTTAGDVISTSWGVVKDVGSTSFGVVKDIGSGLNKIAPWNW